MSSKKPAKVTLSLPRNLIREIDAEVSRLRKARPGIPISRSGVMREILAHWASLDREERSTEPRTYEGLVREATELKEKGNAALSEGGHRRARKLFLQSAVRELQALAILDDPDPRRVEALTKTTLVEVVVLLKLATGYIHLPDVPSKPRIKLTEDQAD